MNFKIIKQLYKKEILDVLRDKKTVIMMLVVPLVLYPLVMIFSLQIMTSISTSMEEHTYIIAFDFNDEDGKFASLFNDMGTSGNNNFKIVSSNDCETMLVNEEIDAFIRKNSGEKENFEVYYMSSVTNSNYAADLIGNVLGKYSLSLTKKAIKDAGLDVDKVLNPIEIQNKDVSTGEQTAGSLLGMLIPFMLITSLLMGTMYPAIDTTAGERERGTLETMLTLPVSNRQLIISKFLTVGTIGIVSAFLNVISMGGVGIYMYNMVMSLGSANKDFNMGQFIPAIIIGILCVFAFAVFISAITMCVTAFAKSYKEANNYITPLMLIVMFASFVGFIPNVTLSPGLALVPVVNICLVIRDMLVFKYSVTTITLVLFSNIAYGILSIMILGKIYNSESILFGDDNSGIQIFERRSNMKKGGVPTISDMVLIIAITAVMFIYVGGALQIKLGNIGVFATQFIIVGIPLLASYYTKKDLKKTFRVKTCNVKYFLAGIFMIIGSMMLGVVLSAITSSFFTNDAKQATEAVSSLIGDSFLGTVLLVALTPAICEELMFRGYVLSSLENKIKVKYAILISAIIFGMYHMSIVRFFTTALLGGVICYIAYKSKSILPGMFMHFTNNFLSCLFMFYPKETSRILPFLAEENLTIVDGIIVLVLGLVLIALGLVIVNKNKVCYYRK